MHNFCLLNIRRPVLSSVFSLLLVVFGLYTFFQISTRELPKDLQPPVVEIRTNYTGASPSIISSEISEPIELAVGGAEGIKSIDTLSEIGRSTIKIEFFTDIDVDNAANDIRERVSRIIDNLPEESKAPEIRKASAGFSTSMWLSVSSTSWTSLDIGDYVKRNLVDSFSSVPGTGRIIVGGINEKAVRVYLNPIKLSANDLEVKEVEEAIRKNNVSIPAGTIEANNVDLTLDLGKTYKNLNDIKKLPIKKIKSKTITLEDVGEIKYGPVSEKTLFKAQSRQSINENTVGIGIYARTNESTVTLSKNIRNKIKEVRKTLPAGLTLSVSFDRAVYIKEAIMMCYQSILLALALVVGIIYLFLGNVRAMIVPAITLPVSLIGAALGLWVFGLTINIFTLLAVILSVAIVTDDSVVMTESIYYRIEKGDSPLVAAAAGSKNVIFAILSTSIIILATFAPLLFIGGISGTLFREMAITLSITIVISTFTALSIAPMLGSKLLSRKHVKSNLVLRFERLFKSFESFYSESLNYWIQRPKTIIWFMIFVLVIASVLFKITPKTLLEKNPDRGVYLVFGKTDESSSFEYTVNKAEQVETRLIPLLQKENEPYQRLIMRVPGFGRSSQSYNSFIIIALLDNWKDRKESAQKIVRKAIGKIVTVPGTMAFPLTPNSVRVSNYQKPVVVTITGPSYEKLYKWQNLIIEDLRKNKNLADITSDYTKNKPEVELIIDEKKAKDLGLSIQSIGKSVETLFSGKTVTKLNESGKEYPIILQADLKDRRRTESLSKIFVRSETTGKLISLANVVRFEEKGSAKLLSRYQRSKSITLTARLVGGYTLNEALDFIEKTIDDKAPSAGIYYKGKSLDLKEASSELLVIFALAMVSAYLVMAGTFNAWRQPLVVMLTVPLAAIGGLIFILLFDSTINIFSQIALVVLIGIATKNSILIVDWANQLRVDGKSVQAAIVESCKRRFRPIIMTSLSTLIAMMPLIIGNIGPGAGEGIRLAVGCTIFGGMLISTFLTLFTTPVFYLLLCKNSKRMDDIDLQLSKEFKK
jgi:hydrophobe/amphiphile efflux-1 (HAE1) family protein